MQLKLETTLAAREEIAGPVCTSPDAVEAQLKDMRSLAQEAFVALTFNTKNRLIARHLISLGTVNSTLVHPREVFRPAILDGAYAIIVAHNHPTGDPCPSAEDIKITRKLVEAGQHIDIQVLDHLIIGDTAVSLKEEGLVAFR